MTQTGNVAAQRLYQSLGLRSRGTTAVLHLWLDEGVKAGRSSSLGRLDDIVDDVQRAVLTCVKIFPMYRPASPTVVIVKPPRSRGPGPLGWSTGIGRPEEVVDDEEAARTRAAAATREADVRAPPEERSRLEGRPVDHGGPGCRVVTSMRLRGVALSMGHVDAGVESSPGERGS